MTLYLNLKLIHILSATVLLGTGLGSAFFLWRTYRSDDSAGLATVTRVVVVVDRVFIAPAVVIQFVTGVWLITTVDYSLFESWILAALGLYVVAGGCWLPAAWLQTRMHSAVVDGESGDRKYPPRRFHQSMVVWVRLGIIAFVAVLLIFYLMVFKPTLW